jgi:hypothetical protein
MHHLIHGTDVKIMQWLGQWTSDAFYIYWCNMQAIIPLHIHNALQCVEIIQEVDIFLHDASTDVKKRWKEIEKAQDELSTSLLPLKKRAKTSQKGT